MKLLITGGVGFIGSALARLALENGHDVMNIDCMTYAASRLTLDRLNLYPQHSHEAISICDAQQVNNIISNYKPDAVIHLAAETHVDRSITSPKAFVDTNIIGTFNIL